MLLGGEITIANLGPTPQGGEKVPYQSIVPRSICNTVLGAKSPSLELESLFKNSCHTRATNVSETTSSPIS